MIGKAIFISMSVSLSCAHAQGRNVVWDDEIVPYFIEKKAESLGDFADILTHRWTETLIVVYAVDGIEKEKRISSCNDLLGTARIRDTKPSSDYLYLTTWKISCAAMQRLLHFKKSDVSYLSLDAKTMAVELGKVKFQHIHNQDRNFFAGLEKAEEVTCTKKSLCSVKTQSDRFLIHMMAAGDFNSDRIEDVLIHVGSGPLEGTSSAARHLGFVITRLRPNGGLRVLDLFGSGE